MKSVLAADLGGTKCRYSLVTEDLRVLAPIKVPTAMDRASFLATMDESLAALRECSIDDVEPPSAIGVGAAGIVRADTDVLYGAPNLPVGGYALRGHLERAFELPAVIINDGRAAAWGEYLRGDARGSDPLLLLFFGTGIGIGLMAAGQPYAGANNAAGEIGHGVFRAGGRRCPCGNAGCYEAYCGGGPMAQRAAEEIGEPPAGHDRWTVMAIREAAATHAGAAGILADAQAAACAMTATLCTLLNPAAVVIGGGVISGWPELAPAIETFTAEWCHDAVRSSLRFAASSGGSDAVLWGAAKATGVW